MKPVLLRALQSSQGYQFDRNRPFKEYQGGAAIRNVINEEITACVKGYHDKQERNLVSIVSGMGNGKSRLLDEMKAIMQGNKSFKKRTCYTLYCNFENGTRAEPVPLGDGGWDQVRKEILDRIMFILMIATTDGPCPRGVNDLRMYGKKYKWNFTLNALIGAIHDVASGAIVMVLVDGAHSMDPVPTEGLEDYYQKSCMRQVYHVLSDAICWCPRVFAACTSVTPLLLQLTATDGPNVKKLLVTPPPMTRMPKEVTNRLVLKHKKKLLQLFGGHPRTLEFLVGNTSTTLSDIFEAAVAALQGQYKLSEVGTDVLVPLLQRILTGDGMFCLDEKIGGITCDTLTRLGLVKIQRSDLNKQATRGVRYPLHVSALLMLFLRHRDNNSVLTMWRPYYEGADAFEQFAASVRCIRSHVCEDETSLKNLHAGARWLKGGDTRVVKAPMQLAQSVKEISTRSCDEAAPKPSTEQTNDEGDWRVELCTLPGEGEQQALTTSSGDIGNYTILNAHSAPDGDFFCRLKRSGDGHFNEVAQCKSKSLNAKGNQSIGFSDEIGKSVSSGDAFIMISQDDLPVAGNNNIPDGIHCAVVGPDNFHAYYGPLSGTVVIPSSSMLASRPVWPALLSRGSHIPHHMRKTPLPPTRTMIPFFRRLCKLI